ncbi:Hg(II)-responsive transcriptional regulator [Paenibacillus baekrokdamisoli]|uniref:Hg(II)-responsive transcriptional regulator n=1 Tax=Paenibacillus baekrokdamisoli TaxID=1712516 RepID=A0A3G9JCR0_9BACL|nr:MerR family transcriptional regulator [Paenibacillus baekrokdamisoli]MBB3068224.1 DNA-binding transcriptional MerR regulator [Paenibacillus baekrokdamisoli]BBH22733.1 Hg(II)-responsive transcriptional regulator [Paenibacillus baekrokdamisoli]
MTDYLRGQIAKLAELNIETLRYYENHGLIPSPARSESGYRLYSEEVLTRLTFIKNAKFCGFTLREIEKALSKSQDGSISVADFIAVIERKTSSINKEIAKKEQTKKMLEELKTNLQMAEKNPEVLEVLQILHMKS